MPATPEARASRHRSVGPAHRGGRAPPAELRAMYPDAEVHRGRTDWWELRLKNDYSNPRRPPSRRERRTVGGFH